MNTLLRLTLAGLLALCGLPALAVNYVIPGNLPPGCGGSGASYTCPGGGGLAYNDTVTIASATPITVTVTGNMATNNARINQGGTASNLTLIVNGTLTAEYQAVINANVQATVFNGSGSEVVVGGNLTATGAITLGYRTRVNGNVSGTSLSTGTEITFGGNVATTTGALSISNTSTVAGNVTSTSGAISLANSVQVAGQVSCSCAVSLANMARVNGNVSAASVTATSQAYLMGSVTTTGAVDVAYATSLGGAVTAGGAIRLRGNTQASQCLRSTSSSAITLEWADRANGGVCCGSASACTTSCVVNNSGAAMPALCSGAAPARFNAFETSTASGITGVIRTKQSGTSFNVAIVAVNTAGTGVATTFTGNVRVEVLDATNNTGALSSTTNCRSSWTTASGTSATTLTFASADAGRKNVTLTVPDAFRDARIRVIYPDTGTATATGCSTDNFAIRPAGFVIAASDTTSSTSNITGTTRPLANTANGSGNVHMAGRPFTVRATAVGGSGATTSNYNGVVNGQASSTPCVGAACGGTVGTLSFSATTASAGQLSTHTATYSEAGAFNLRLVDDTFAVVDASDGSTPLDREIATIAAVGRFVPDHFEIVAAVAPVLRTFDASCTAARSFTYLGQAFGYSTLPTATVYPRSFGGGAIANYPTSKWSTVAVTQTYGVTPSSPGLVTTNAILPSLTSGGSGTGTLQFPANTPNTLTMTRPTSGPVANFSATVMLHWTVADNTETSVTGNETIQTTNPTPTMLFPAIAFDQGNEFRYGQLKLGSAYGSELVALAVPLETQYWNGTGFVTNTQDNCTVLPTSSVSLASFRGSLAACETATSATSVSFSTGRAVLRLAAPGNGNKGSVDGTLQLGASLAPAGALRCAAIGPSAVAAAPANIPWLQSRAPGGTTFDQNPSARFSFGQYRSPLIRLREMY